MYNNKMAVASKKKIGLMMINRYRPSIDSDVLGGRKMKALGICPFLVSICNP